MEVSLGYKQTEVGVIPEDWEAVELNAACSMKSGEGITAASIDDYSEYPCYGGNGLRGYTSRSTHDGSFALIGRQGALCGNVVGVQGKFFASEHAVVVTALPGTDIAFLTYVLGQMRLNQYSESSAQPGLSVSKVLRLSLAVPPTEAEQRVIATALADVDALLVGLDRLIAKKRDLKQAAMQQLLTGQTRLPGFHSEWEAMSLDMLTSRATGVWGKTEPDERNSCLAEVIRAGDISQDGRLTATAARYVAPEEFEKAKCALDDLVITTSGNGLGKLWWCDGRSNVAASNFVRVLHPDIAKTVGRFLYYALRTGEGLRQLQEHTATSAYPNLRPTYFSTAWIPSPRRPEQTAIAAVLFDADAELKALEARRDKTRDLKQAMMQELLTGRTRLVSSGAAHA